MTLSIPAFHQFPKEAELIGRILIGYGEIEYSMLTALGAVLGDLNVTVKVMYRTRGEEQRLEIADALMRHEFEKVSLSGPYCEAMADAHWCRRIRNQYAHSHFDSYDGVLSFSDLEETAKQKPQTTRVKRRPLKLSLLQEQEAYFGYVQWCWFFLGKEYQKKAGSISIHDATLPKKVPRPLLHSGPP
jgi:hypothetical protein